MSLEPATVGRLVEELCREWGAPDVLVNNAGLSTAGPALELTREDFDVTFAVDVRATFLLMQEAARAMEGEGGVIVNVTVCLAPRGSEIRSNPTSVRIGTGADEATSVRYNWTTSSPAISPVFFTSTLTLIGSPAFTDLALNRMLS